MPHSRGKAFKFYDRQGNDYPFFAADGKESTAISYAKAWARKRGLKLFRRR